MARGALNGGHIAAAATSPCAVTLIRQYLADCAACCFPREPWLNHFLEEVPDRSVRLG